MTATVDGVVSLEVTYDDFAMQAVKNYLDRSIEGVFEKMQNGDKPKEFNVCIFDDNGGILASRDILVERKVNMTVVTP